MVRISFTPGAALATKSKVRASGPRRATNGIFSWRLRYSFSDSSVSIDIAKRPGRHLALLERGAPDLEEVGQVALGVDLADERALAVLRGEQRERRGDGRLADAALAGDEEQLAIEQVGGHRPHLPERGGSASEADAAAVVGAADLDVGELLRGHAHLAALAVGEPEGAAGRQRGVDLLRGARRRRRRRRAGPRAPWGSGSDRCGRPRDLLRWGRRSSYGRSAASGTWGSGVAASCTSAHQRGWRRSTWRAGTVPRTMARRATGSASALPMCPTITTRRSERDPVVHERGAGAPGQRERVEPPHDPAGGQHHGDAPGHEDGVELLAGVELAHPLPCPAGRG